MRRLMRWAFNFLATVSLLTWPTMGCVQVKTVNPPLWTYEMQGKSDNLLGDGKRENLRFQLEPEEGLNLLPSGERLILARGLYPQIWIAVLYPTPAARHARLNLSTDTNEVRAWLIRPPELLSDAAGIRARVAELTSLPPEPKFDPALALLMCGSVHVEQDDDRLMSLDLDLRTIDPVPPYVRSFREGRQGQAAWEEKGSRPIGPFRPAHIEAHFFGYWMKWYLKPWPFI